MVGLSLPVICTAPGQFWWPCDLGKGDCESGSCWESRETFSPALQTCISIITGFYFYKFLSSLCRKLSPGLQLTGLGIFLDLLPCKVAWEQDNSSISSQPFAHDEAALSLQQTHLLSQHPRSFLWMCSAYASRSFHALVSHLTWRLNLHLTVHRVHAQSTLQAKCFALLKTHS